MSVTASDVITELKPNEIFVFGSNLAGRHGAGAARQAREQFGAVYGVGEGLTGQCYAFPTLGVKLGKRTRAGLETSRDTFYAVACSHPELTFLLTKVGCGLAGYPEEQMIRLFSTDCPENVVKPDGW